MSESKHERNESEKCALFVFAMLYIGVFWIIPWVLTGTIKGVAISHVAIALVAFCASLPYIIIRWSEWLDRNVDKDTGKYGSVG